MAVVRFTTSGTCSSFETGERADPAPRQPSQPRVALPGIPTAVEQVVGLLIEWQGTCVYAARHEHRNDVTDGMADMNRRAWLIVAVVALAVPGSIYLGYELQRRNQICSAALAFRERAVTDVNATMRPAFQSYSWSSRSKTQPSIDIEHPDIVQQLHDYCGID